MKHELFKPLTKKVTINLPNTELLWISYEETESIPHIGPGQMHFTASFDEEGNVDVRSEKSNIDPSTLFMKLPIEISNQPAAPLSYWPSYYGMNPIQRYTYINWLQDVTKTTDMGYVFTYYYGLERHLLLGNFNGAFYEIIKLRNYHTNKSFQTYSESALIYSCLLKKDYDKLLELNELTTIQGFTNIQLSIAHKLKVNLSAENLLKIFRNMERLSYKPLKENPLLLLLCTKEALTNIYSTESFSFYASYDFDKIRCRLPLF